MTDIQITRAQWPQFCEEFSRQHHGWLVHLCQVDTGELEAGDAEAVATPLPGDRPLQEIRSDRGVDASEIMVTMGQGRGETSVLVERVTALYSRQIGAAHMGLRIDSDNGTSTLFEFRAAAAPESLNGLADVEL